MKQFDYDDMTCIKTRKINDKLTVRLYSSNTGDDLAVALDHITLRDSEQEYPTDSQILITVSTLKKLNKKLAEWDVF